MSMRKPSWVLLWLFATLIALVATPVFALSDAEHAELMKDEEYKDAYEGYTQRMADAKERITPEEYKQLEAENAKSMEEDLKASEEEIKAGELVQVYSTMYFNQFYRIEQRMLWAWLKQNPTGVQGFYRLESDAFDGILLVEEGDELYGVTLTVTMKNEPFNSGELEGPGTLEGSTLKAEDMNDEEAVVTIVFDGDKAALTTTDAFKSSGWAGAGVVFDGTYVRQKTEQ